MLADEINGANPNHEPASGTDGIFLAYKWHPSEIEERKMIEIDGKSGSHGSTAGWDHRRLSDKGRHWK